MNLFILLTFVTWRVCAEEEAGRTRRVPCGGFRARIEFPEALNRRGEGMYPRSKLTPIHSAQATLSRMSAGLIEYYEHAQPGSATHNVKTKRTPTIYQNKAPHPDSLNAPQKTPQYS